MVISTAGTKKVKKKICGDWVGVIDYVAVPVLRT